MKEVFNPENMMKIFSSINSKITDNNDLSKEDLASEATNICSTMKDNPLFSQLMGLQSGMFSQMQTQPTHTTITKYTNKKNVCW